MHHARRDLLRKNGISKASGNSHRGRWVSRPMRRCARTPGRKEHQARGYRKLHAEKPGNVTTSPPSALPSEPIARMPSNRQTTAVHPRDMFLGGRGLGLSPSQRATRPSLLRMGVPASLRPSGTRATARTSKIDRLTFARATEASRPANRLYDLPGPYMLTPPYDISYTWTPIETTLAIRMVSIHERSSAMCDPSYSGRNCQKHSGSNGCTVNSSNFGTNTRFLRFQAPYLPCTLPIEAVKN